MGSAGRDETTEVSTDVSRLNNTEMNTNIDKIMEALLGQNVDAIDSPTKRHQSGVFTGVSGVLVMQDGHYEVTGPNSRWRTSIERRRLVTIDSIEIHSNGRIQIHGEQEMFIRDQPCPYVPSER